MKHIIVIHGDRQNGKSSAAAHLAASHAMGICRQKNLDPHVAPRHALWLDLKQEWADERLKRMPDLGITPAAIQLIKPMGVIALANQPLGFYDLIVCDNWDHWPRPTRDELMSRWEAARNTDAHRLLVLVRETP